MKSSVIFLTGLPGVGKTYWGKKWAEENNWSFIDLDRSIELTAGRTIADIFKKDGEPAFRKIEAESLKIIIDSISGDTIIAVGGGTLTLAQNPEPFS